MGLSQSLSRLPSRNRGALRVSDPYLLKEKERRKGKIQFCLAGDVWTSLDLGSGTSVSQVELYNLELACAEHYPEKTEMNEEKAYQTSSIERSKPKTQSPLLTVRSIT